MSTITSNEIKLIADGYRLKCRITEEGESLRLKFPFNRTLLAEIKAMAGSRWDPDNKTWSIKNNERNWFQLAYLTGNNPYAWYDRPLEEMVFSRPLYAHQKDMARHGWTYRQVEWAAEMGTGKSLALIEVMEASRALESNPEWLYVGPKSAIASFQLELWKWNSQIVPTIVTYEGLIRLIENWPVGKRAPIGVGFDEASRLKNPTAKRSIAATHLAAAIRRDWPNHGGFVILMSGTPSPKGPQDWWSQCEIACPGFIKEGTIEKFKARLGLTVQKESVTGGKYPHHITWWDDERKCGVCGQMADHYNHSADAAILGASGHPYQRSKNEIAYLYDRMKGLVLVKFKKDVLAELPEKRFRVIDCEPTRATLNAAKLVVAGASTTIQAMTLLRELSDGFQYTEVEAGQITCSECRGTRETSQPVPLANEEELAAAMDALKSKWDLLFDENGTPVPDHLLIPDKFEMKMLPCPKCGGEGTTTQYRREAQMVACPKDNALMDIIDSHDEDGRLVVYGAFQGSIDRIVQVVEKMQWDWIKVDGRGWTSSFGALKPVEMLKEFQDKGRKIPRICFIGHPESAGMGLTLTESCEIVNFSLTFNYEAYAQSLDRIHRPGMDLNKGALITSLHHLPSDKVTQDNLDKKRKLQDLSLGSFQEAFRNMALTMERRI